MITILTKEKERATRKKEEEEKKAVVALLVFIMAAVVFCQIKTVGRKKGPFGGNVFKNPARYTFCYSKSRMCSSLEWFGEC